MDELIYFAGLLISSFVTVHMVMELLKNVFEPIYNRKTYILVEIIYILLLASINELRNEWLNLCTVLLASTLVAIKCFEGKLKLKIINIAILAIFMSACEAIGIAILHFIYDVGKFTISTPRMEHFFEITFSQVVLIFTSRLIIIKIFKQKNLNNLTSRQYIITFVYTIFSVINIYSLCTLLKNNNSNMEVISVLITTTGIVLINTYFLNILEYESEYNRLQYENQLFIQQSKMQYLYYDNLENQYRDSLSIIHDVKRHIRAIEELYEQREMNIASEYAATINSRLDAFKLNELSNNRVLNIILNDKQKTAEQNGIDFSCKIDDVDLSFIDNIDLTTIFANLLDNAIEACLRKKGDRSIQVQVGAFHNLVAINIRNTMENSEEDEEQLDNRFKLDNLFGHSKIHNHLKENHNGIGLLNVTKVVKKYNGDFNIEKDGDYFICTIVLSKLGREVMEE